MGGRVGVDETRGVVRFVNLTSLSPPLPPLLSPRFYRKTLQNQFLACLSNQSQQRYSLAYVQLCDAFSFNGNEFLPEERLRIGQEAGGTADSFLKKIAEHATVALHNLALEHLQLGEQLLPEHAVQHLVARGAGKSGAGGRSRGGAASGPSLPGAESHQGPGRSQELTQRLTQQQQTLSDLCWALDHHVRVPVFNVAFSPREFLVERLHEWVSSALGQLTNVAGGVPPRPSHCLHKIKSYLAALRSVENYVNIDVSTILASSLLEQTVVGETAQGAQVTIATAYVNFYLEFIMKHGGARQVLISESRRCLVSKPGLEIKAEHYTDAAELRALCRLIGPYGVKQLNERLLGSVKGLVGDLKAIALSNQSAIILHSKTESGDACNEALKAMTGTDQGEREREREREKVEREGGDTVVVC